MNGREGTVWHVLYKRLNYVFDIILTSTYSEKPGLLMMIWGVFANFHRARTQPAGWLPRQEPHCVPPRGKRDKLWGGFAASQIMPLYNFMRFGSLKIARMTCLSCAKKVVGPFFYFLLRSTGGKEKLRALSSKSITPPTLGFPQGENPKWCGPVEPTLGFTQLFSPLKYFSTLEWYRDL